MSRRSSCSSVKGTDERRSPNGAEKAALKGPKFPFAIRSHLYGRRFTKEVRAVRKIFTLLLLLLLGLLVGCSQGGNGNQKVIIIREQTSPRHSGGVFGCPFRPCSSGNRSSYTSSYTPSYTPTPLRQSQGSTVITGDPRSARNIAPRGTSVRYGNTEYIHYPDGSAEIRRRIGSTTYISTYR